MVPGTPALLLTHILQVLEGRRGGLRSPWLLLDLRICTPRPHAPGLWVIPLGSGGLWRPGSPITEKGIPAPQLTPPPQEGRLRPASGKWGRPRDRVWGPRRKQEPRQRGQGHLMLTFQNWKEVSPYLVGAGGHCPRCPDAEDLDSHLSW